MVDADVNYVKPKMGQSFLFLINKNIEIVGLTAILFAPCSAIWMVLWLMKSQFLTAVPNETMYETQIINLFNATHPIIMPLQLTRYFMQEKEL